METEKPKSNNDFRSCLCKDITRSSESKQTHSYLQTGGGGIWGGAQRWGVGTSGSRVGEGAGSARAAVTRILSVETPHRHTTYVKIKTKSMGGKKKIPVSAKP